MLLVTMGQDRRHKCCGVGGQLERCEVMSYPEKQCYQNIVKSREDSDWDAASPEEKEPTIKVEVK